MGVPSETPFDLGPLTWVKDEIDQAITRGLESLSKFGERPDDKTALKQAQSHIHQAAGALQIVGLDGAITLIEEIERHLLLLETAPHTVIDPEIAAISSASRRLTRYLDDLVQGAAPVTLKLYPDYVALCHLRGNQGASPTDLFFPDLTRSPRHLAASGRRGPVPQTPHFLRHQRRAYQQGLLAILRGDRTGVAVMQQAIHAIENAMAGTSTASFWWTVGGFLATVADNTVLPSNPVKQLFARIDLQIRRFVEGSAKVSDRLRREVLYHIAVSPPASPRVQEIQSLYGLPAMLPSDEGQREVDLDQLRPALKRSQELIAAVQEQWLRFTSGRQESLPLLRKSAEELEVQVRALNEPALSDLVSALHRVPAAADAANGASEQLAMEFATAVLLTSDALNHFARLSPDFRRQSEAMCRRLDLAQRGVVSLPGAGEDLLDDTARRAQEQLLIANVAREIQANLRYVEKVLDAFFRDATERGELGTLARFTGQIQGALSMLGLSEAGELLTRSQKQIDAYVAGANPEEAELERLAESLSGLGFYIEAVEQQRPDALRILQPFLDARSAQVIAGAPAPETLSIESDLETHREELPATVARFRAAPEDPTLRAELDHQLQSLKQDADLVADADFSAQAASALDALHDADAPTAKVLATLDDMTLELPAEAPAPSDETKRLLEAGDATFDLELSDIFVTEAGAVLAAIGQALASCAGDARNVEALRSIRRGFHTLKGSGRMVGQLELGESAWRVEMLLSRWLDEERAITPSLLAVLVDAQRSFAGWIAELRTTGAVRVDDRRLVEGIARLDAEGAGSPTRVDKKEGLRSSAPLEPAADFSFVAPVVEATQADDPGAPVPAFEDFASSAERPQSAEPDQIVIGPVKLSSALYETLLEESRNLLRTLERDHATLQFDVASPPPETMIRAAHTLHGIHRTAGFVPVADTAAELELTLSTLRDAAHRPEETLHVLAEAIECLNDLADFVGMHKPFDVSSLERAADTRDALVRVRDAAAPLPVVVAELPATIDEPVALLEPELERRPPQEPQSIAPIAAFAAPIAVRAPSDDELPLHEDPMRERLEVLASVQDELDPDLLRVFLDEANELLPRAGALVRDWRRTPSNPQYADDLRRTLHTLKGSARMAGAMRLGELAHVMETRLEATEGQAITPALCDALDADLDQQAALIESLQLESMRPQAPLQPTVEAVATAAVLAPTIASPGMRVGALTSISSPAAAVSPSDDAGDSAEATPQQMSVRVRADIIDRLVNETGEVSIARARIEGELRSLKSNLLELTGSVIRLRGQTREIEMQAETQIQSRMSQMPDAEGFDPLEFDRFTRFQELARSLAEGVNDVATVQQALIKNLDDADAALMAQARLSRDIQQQLLAVRTVPFASSSGRLYRVLRQTAKELGKKVNLDIRGGQTELDRGVLDKLIAPLEHLLRNAIGHGIEAPQDRLRADKAETGEIAITVRQEGNEIALTLSDDGRGLSLDDIKAKAIELGVFAPGSEPTETQLIDAIFAPGFTTAHEVSRISGRGIGMDVVRSEIHALGGRIEVATTKGRGTTFTLYLPLTLAITQAVLVRAGGRIHAVPAALVEQVQQVKADNLVRHYATGVLNWQTRTYPFHYLPQLLGDADSGPDPQRYNPVLLLKSANQRVAVHVDEMLGNQEIVIKNIGAQLARLPGLSGATVLGTGEIVLILNPVQLLARHAASKALAPSMSDEERHPAMPKAVEAAPQHLPSVLVVDDSLTVRKITTRLLARDGYAVASARDGVDALQWLADQTADAILLDIEMPRMDGFEFARTIRNDPRLSSIPIIMITSRTADKHRARAAELGIEAYLGKPFQEEELLRHLKRLVAEHAARKAAAAEDPLEMAIAP